MPFKDLKTFEVLAQTALSYAILFTKKAQILVPPIKLEDLLKPNVLLRAIDKVAGIQGWLTMDTLPMEGYVSWLGIWLGEKNPPSIAIKSNVFTELLQREQRTFLHKHAMFVLLAIVLHEVGHEVMRDPAKPRKFRILKGGTFYADAESLKSEAEAWFFSFFLSGLIFAQIASAERPDRVHEYLI